MMHVQLKDSFNTLQSSEHWVGYNWIHGNNLQGNPLANFPYLRMSKERLLDSRNALDVWTVQLERFRCSSYAPSRYATVRCCHRNLWITSAALVPFQAGTTRVPHVGLNRCSILLFATLIGHALFHSCICIWNFQIHRLLCRPAIFSPLKLHRGRISGMIWPPIYAATNSRQPLYSIISSFRGYPSLVWFVLLIGLCCLLLLRFWFPCSSCHYRCRLNMFQQIRVISYVQFLVEELFSHINASWSKSTIFAVVKLNVFFMQKTDTEMFVLGI